MTQRYHLSLFEDCYLQNIFEGQGQISPVEGQPVLIYPIVKKKKKIE